MKQFYSDELTSDTAYKATFQGDLFQLKLLMAVALRARTSGQPFMLNTEVVEAEKFDDLVVEYQESATVLQAKHTTSQKNYKKSDFLAGRQGDAALVKYFDSYARLRERGLFGKKSVAYVFFTNRSLEQDDFSACLTPSSEPDQSLIFETEGAQCLKFSDDFLAQINGYQALYQVFQTFIIDQSSYYYSLLSKKLQVDVSDYKADFLAEATQLTSEIVRSMSGDYDQNEQASVLIQLKGAFVSSRNLMLSFIETDGVDGSVSFTSDFINQHDLTEFQQSFRADLEMKIRGKFEVSEKDVEEMLSVIRFKFPKTIATCVWMSRKKDKQVNNVVIKKDSNNSGADLFWRPNKEFSRFVVGMFGKFNFQYQPDDSVPMSDLTIYKTLQKAITVALSGLSEVNMAQVDQQFKAQLHGFFRDFRLKIGQPNEAELDRIILKELNTSLNFSHHEYYAQFHMAMTNWFKDLQGQYISKEGLDGFFDQMRVGIERLHLIGYSQHATRLLQGYQRTLFGPAVLQPIQDFIQASNGHNILLLSSDDALGATLATCRAVTDLMTKKSILHEDNWGFVDPDCRIIDRVPEVLSQRFQLMVIDHAEELINESIGILTDTIKVAVDSNKKLILICSEAKKSNLKAIVPEALVPERSLQEHEIALLSDQQIAAMCQEYQDKTIHLAGRHVLVSDILAQKSSGVYAAMRSISQLMLLLGHASAKPAVKQSNTPGVYVPQLVRTYQATYTIDTAVQTLPKDKLLLLLSNDNAVFTQPFFLKCLRLDINKLNAVSKDILQQLNDKKCELDMSDILSQCQCEAWPSERLQKYINSRKAVLYLSVSEIGLLETSTQLLRCLRGNLPVVITANTSLKEVSGDDLIVGKLNKAHVELVSFEDKRYFAQPTFQLNEGDEPSGYDGMALCVRTKQNLPTCITANPGTGKSENFCYLADRWSKEINLVNQYHWLIMVNLTDITEQTLKQPLADVLVDTLCRSRGIDLSKEMRELWLNILRYDLANHQVKLLLDGWDEVKGGQQEVVRTFVERLPETVHYDLAMRPYVFNAAPGVIYQRVELQPFSDDDVSDYLKKRFSQMVVSKSSDESKLNVFVKKTMAWLHDADSMMRDTVKIPLLAFLLSELLKEHWLNWVDSKEEQPFGPWHEVAELNLLSLYEFFILAKLKYYLKQHMGIEKEATLDNPNRVLQLTAKPMGMMAASAFGELFPSATAAQKKCSPELQRALLDVGIVSAIANTSDSNPAISRLQFIQQTFKELFAAIYIVKAMARPSSDSRYQQVFSVVKTMRYEISLKVVWQFVRDLLQGQSELLSIDKSELNARAIFSMPEDHIGVASQNLMEQLGMSEVSLPIREMKPSAARVKKISVNAFPVFFEEKKVESVDEKLRQLDQVGNKKDDAIRLLTSLPKQMPVMLTDEYQRLMSRFLNSWSYKVRGEVASQLSKIEIQITPQLNKQLIRVVKDDNCRSFERIAAIRAMLKVDKTHYRAVFKSYSDLLADAKVNAELKCELLFCLVHVASVSNDFHSEIEALARNFKGVASDSFLYSDALLIRLLLLKKATGKFFSITGRDLVKIAKTIASDLTQSRLKTIEGLMSEKIITYQDVRDELISSLKMQKNKDAALTWAKKLYVISGDEADQQALASLLCDKPDLSLPGCLFEGAVLQGFKPFKSTSNHNFWRVDAGLPVAKFFIGTRLNAIGVAYIIFQIRHNLLEYDVSSHIANYLAELKADTTLERCSLLYLMFEYVTASCSINPGLDRFRPLDSYPALLSSAIELAWQHYIEDSRYPLVGLDVIFAIGVFYGLPLIEEDDRFHLQFSNITQYAIQSPQLNSHQKRIVREHFASLRQLAGRDYSLMHIRDDSDRVSLTTPSFCFDMKRFDRSTIFSIATKGREETVDTDDIDNKAQVGKILHF